MTHPETPAPMTEEDAKALAWINEQARLFGKYGELSIPAIMGRLDKAEAEIERHRSSPSTAAGGWQAIETAPRSGVFIDLWHAKQGRVADCRWFRNRDGFEGWHAQQGGRAWNMMQSDGTHEFTHWRNRPEPPK